MGNSEIKTHVMVTTYKSTYGHDSYEVLMKRASLITYAAWILQLDIGV